MRRCVERLALKGEIDQPRMTDLSRLAFRRLAYPALTPANMGHTWEALLAVTLHRAHSSCGVGAAQGSKWKLPS